MRSNSLEEGLLRDVHSPSHRDRPLWPILIVAAVVALTLGVFVPLGFSFPMMALTIVGTAIATGGLWVLGMLASDRLRRRAARAEAENERSKPLH